MTALIATLLATVPATVPAMAGPNEDAAAARAQWEQVYNSGDADKFVALYTKDALLFGSTASFTGADGMRLLIRSCRRASRSRSATSRPSRPDQRLLSSGFADFTLKNGTVIPFRVTLALVKVDGQWLIAQHHGSPVPK